MRARSLVLASAALALSLGTACELLINGDLSFQPYPDEAGPPARDASFDSSFDGSFCPYSVEPDTTPAPGDDGDAGTGNVVILALRTINIGDPTGVDIDHLCTCQYNANNSCVPPKDAPKGGACDADGGIDDRAAQLYAGFPGITGLDFIKAANQFTRCGQRAILIGLADYNGLRNDTSVKLNVVTSPGLYNPHFGGGDDTVDASDCVPRDGGTQTYIPRWDGTDFWSLVPGDAFGDFPSKPTVSGRVKDYQLVVDSRTAGQPSGASFVVNLFGTTDVTVTQPIVLARIRPAFTDGGIVPLDDKGNPTATTAFFVVEGTLVGRTRADDLLRGAAIAPFTPGHSVCEALDGSFLEANKVMICGYRDLMLDPTQDNSGKSCDAISTAFQFVAYPAYLGVDHAADPPAPNPCRPAQLYCDGIPPDAGLGAADAGDAADDANDGM